MKRNFKVCILVMTYFFSYAVYAKLQILTTTTNLKSIVEFVGGDNVDVESFCKGTQDPHYIEAKPSYTLKASKADLLISIGLDFEIGWLPLIVRGSRNPKLLAGAGGRFVAGEFIDTLEKPISMVSRADGDVHPEGNPHFLLDPVNALIIAEKLKEKFKQLDQKNSDVYEQNYYNFSIAMKAKIIEWKKRLKTGKRVISYHKTLTYFYHQFGIENVAVLEPKPGVPPSAGHILDIMEKAKRKEVKLVLVENYFDPTVANRVAKSVVGLKVDIVPVAVDGEKNISNLFALYERLVSAVEDYK